MKTQKAEFLSFNDGITDVFSVDNIAPPGNKPKKGLIAKFSGLRFEYKTIGVKRAYTAMQADVKLSELIQVPMHREISTQDVATINGRQYEIVQAQHFPDTNPASSVLSLSRLEVNYDIAGVP